MQQLHHFSTQVQSSLTDNGLFDTNYAPITLLQEVKSAFLQPTLYLLLLYITANKFGKSCSLYVLHALCICASSSKNHMSSCSFARIICFGQTSTRLDINAVSYSFKEWFNAGGGTISGRADILNVSLANLAWT